MEKNLNSAIATLISVTLLFVYLLPYYMPYSYADPISNDSMIINGSIEIPAGISVTLFIADNNNNKLLVIPPPVFTSSDTFNITVSTNDGVNEGDWIVFRINGKDSGEHVTFIPGTTQKVELHYTPPGPAAPTVGPMPIVATPVPFKINATSTATPTPLPTPVLTVTAEPTAIPTPISSSPIASPSPTATSSVYPVIFAILIGIIILALLILSLRKR